MKRKQESARRLYERLLKESLKSYLHYGFKAIPYWDFITDEENGFPDLLIPKLGRVEEIVTEETFEKCNFLKFSNFLNKGLDVWVLVPLSSMYIAHSCLRGYASRIQPWWFKDNRCYFGNPEVP